MACFRRSKELMAAPKIVQTEPSQDVALVEPKDRSDEDDALSRAGEKDAELRESLSWLVLRAAVHKLDDVVPSSHRPVTYITRLLGDQGSVGDMSIPQRINGGLLRNWARATLSVGLFAGPAFKARRNLGHRVLTAFRGLSAIGFTSSKELNQSLGFARTSGYPLLGQLGASALGESEVSNENCSWSVAAASHQVLEDVFTKLNRKRKVVVEHLHHLLLHPERP